jgi:toxin ParE1/3/4
MLKIQFCEDAKTDIEELRSYLIPLSSSGLKNVVSAIERKIWQIAAFPESGRPSPRDDVREAIEPRYGFTIPYYVNGNTLHILRVYRSMRKPLDYEAFKIGD